MNKKKKKEKKKKKKKKKKEKKKKKKNTYFISLKTCIYTKVLNTIVLIVFF